MKKILLIIYLFVIGSSFPQPALEKAGNFPRWLKAGDFRTDQTSAITFLNRDKKGELNFLIADDIGEIYRMKIFSDTIFQFQQIEFSPKVKAFLNKFTKKDFEEIFFDKHTRKVYLSIEGNNFYSNLDGEKDDYFTMLESVGIYEVNFEGSVFSSNKIVGLKKLDVSPAEEFYKHISNNFGFEGAAVDEKYFYFGFEGFATGKESIDSALIYIVNKKSLTIEKKIFTAGLNIQTICGLYSDANYSLWGIDRNKREAFKIKFDKKLEITDLQKFQLKSPIPGYNEFEYVMALESITMDDARNIYMIDDPWKKFFIPMQAMLEKLDEQTIENYEEFIPIIHKYKLSNRSGESK